MIHYHGMPMSGPRQDVARFLAGRHAFVSFASPRELGIALEVCQTVALDNGAFSLWKNGGDVDVAAYHSWVESVSGHPSVDFALIPDKIDGDEATNVELVTSWVRMGSSVRSVPIWHLHESLEWLGYLVANFQQVAFGSSGEWSMPGTASWWRRMAEAMRVACDSQGRPKAKLHGLRMLDPEIFSRLPFSSADSTNASLNCGAISRFGAYVPPSAYQRAAVIAQRIEAFNSAPRWVPIAEQERLFG